MEAMRAGRARAAGANVGLSTPRRSRGSSARREPGRAPPTASASLRSAGPLSRERKDHLSFLSSAPRRDLPGGCSRFHGSKRKDLIRCFHSRKADKACASLADEVLEEVRYMREEAKENEGVRYVLAIAGCPGSGKSTLAKRLCTKLNARASEEGRGGTAVVIPMDGYHYTRAELDRMQDPKLAHRRRGAHWTFDAEGFVRRVEEASRPRAEVDFASFDHGIGDPVPGAIQVGKHHEILVVEGLYLYLDKEPWTDLMEVFHKKCFIKCPIGLALQRVVHRKVHVLGETENGARRQVDFNDKKNAIAVWRTRKRADLLLPT